MEDYWASTYGDQIAHIYDRLYEDLFDTAGAVELLSDLAQGGKALELGIGTGRIALPLARCGVDISGVDSSEAMVERLRLKPGGDSIPVAIGDFREPPVEGEFALVFIAFNTFFGLLSQEDQITCFRAVAKLLEPGGRFLIEAFVPDASRFDRHQRISVDDVLREEVRLEVSRHDPTTQRVDSQHVMITPAGVKMYPVCIRYSYPSELDLMARLAGLELKERWADWRRAPFTSQSTSHVSVYAGPQR